MKLRTYSQLPPEIQERLVNANVYFSPNYSSFVETCGETLYYLCDGERIQSIRFRQKLLFRWAIFSSEPYEIKSPTKPLDQYLDEVVQTLEQELKVQWVSSTAGGLFSDSPHGCRRIPFGSHVIDLTQDEETLWSRVHSKHRNVIRKSEKEAVEIKSGGIELLDDYLVLDEATWKRSGQAGSGRAYYARQLETMGECIRVYLAYWKDIPQAGAIFHVNSAMCYYMYGASADAPVTGAANLLQWTAIRDMKAAGVRRFSFVGCRIDEDENSKYHGIQRFKERFGGTLERGWLFRKTCKPIYYKLYCLAVQIRTRSKEKYRDGIDQEIHKWMDVQK